MIIQIAMGTRQDCRIFVGQKGSASGGCGKCWTGESKMPEDPSGLLASLEPLSRDG